MFFTIFLHFFVHHQSNQHQSYYEKQVVQTLHQLYKNPKIDIGKRSALYMISIHSDQSLIILLYILLIY